MICKMFAVRYSAVFAFALALACGVLARPGANDIQDDTKPARQLQTSLGSEEAPKMVNERYPSAVLFGRTCGGTIISPTWVISAAHCTLDMPRSVLGGTNESDSYIERGTQRKIKRLVVHPLFTVGPYWLDAKDFNFTQVAAQWDFVLAELKEPLPLDGKTMVAAKLHDELTIPAGLKVGFAGYGTDHFGGYMSHKMHEMQLTVQADEVCADAMEQYESSNMVCTKGRQPRMDSPCAGDSGSGLFDESGRLLGVMSWAQNDAVDCNRGRLGVFSRLASVRDWIREVANV